MAPTTESTQPLLSQQQAADAEAQEAEAVQGHLDVTYGDIAREFFLLGWIGFGGPQAHIGLFQRVRMWGMPGVRAHSGTCGAHVALIASTRAWIN